MGARMADRTMLRVGAVSVGVAVVLAGGAFPASAKDGDVVRERGCGSGSVKLKLSDEDGRIETEFEVDTNRIGQTWRVRIIHNGNRVVSTSRVTKAPSGSFEVRRLLRNASGPDRVRAVAIRGERTCAVAATF